MGRRGNQLQGPLAHLLECKFRSDDQNVVPDQATRQASWGKAPGLQELLTQISKQCSGTLKRVIVTYGGGGPGPSQQEV